MDRSADQQIITAVSSDWLDMAGFCSGRLRGAANWKITMFNWTHHHKWAMFNSYLELPEVRSYSVHLMWLFHLCFIFCLQGSNVNSGQSSHAFRKLTSTSPNEQWNRIKQLVDCGFITYRCTIGIISFGCLGINIYIPKWTGRSMCKVLHIGMYIS